MTNPIKKRKSEKQSSSHSSNDSKLQNILKLNFRQLAKSSSNDIRYIGQLLKHANDKLLSSEANTLTRAEYTIDINAVPVKISDSRDFCFVRFADHTGSFSLGLEYKYASKALDLFNIQTIGEKHPISVS